MSGHSITVAENHKGPFSLTVSDGRHTQQGDVPAVLGGDDSGPSPYDRLMSGLGSCTAMTIKMYADVKKWPLEGVDMTLTHHKELDPATNKFVDVLTRDITLKGELTDEQKLRLLEIANKCPVHRTLESNPEVITVLDPKTLEDNELSSEKVTPRAKLRVSTKDAYALRTVTTSSTGEGKFTQMVTAGKHSYITDEPPSVGGLDRGPNPYEELLFALGTCTATKVRGVAGVGGMPLQDVEVTLDHHKEKDATGKVVDKFERHITLKGNLTDDQRQKLLDAANDCPIFNTLRDGPHIVTKLSNGPAAPSLGVAPAAPKA